jgi:hypothetical protein
MRPFLVISLTLGLAAPAGAAGPDYEIPDGPDRTGPVTITINSGVFRPFFAGPRRVSSGARLTVRNASSPDRVGPHTFSLVRRSALPRTKRARRTCGAHVCGRIAKAHRFNRQTLRVRRRTVDVGRKGWDRSFGKVGDTWYVDKKGRAQTRRVTAPAGTTLRYFCATHPTMSGAIRVVA